MATLESAEIDLVQSRERQKTQRNQGWDGGSVVTTSSSDAQLQLNTKKHLTKHLKGDDRWLWLKAIYSRKQSTEYRIEKRNKITFIVPQWGDYSLHFYNLLSKLNNCIWSLRRRLQFIFHYLFCLIFFRN